MSLDHLKAYIDQFRVWLAEHGEAGLESRGDLVTQWQEELAAAERLLDEKPELPIAFLGPSQQGKSSLINALLGENILAVGGAVGACTCVITSLHYHAHKNYRAEIEFIAIKDWKRELESIRTSTSSKPTDDDLDIDRRELEADQLAALEKLKAVYRLSGHGRRRRLSK